MEGFINKISRLHRLQLIYELILNKSEESALSITEIWQIIGLKHGVQVSRKTVQRDILELSERYRILSVGEEPVRYYADGQFRPDYNLAFSEKELQAILIALENLKNTGHPYFKKQCEEAEIAIFSKLPKSLSETLLNSKESLFFSTGTIGKPIANDNDSFDKVVKALRENKCIECQNSSPYKSKEYNKKVRKFAPLIFNMADQVPYLIAEDLEDNQIKRLRITRLSNVKILDIPVNKEKLKELKNLSQSIGGWGGKDEGTISLIIYCDDKIATFFSEREIHHSQKLETINSNEYLVSLEVAASNELPRFLASLGDGINKIEPESIWDDVLKFWRSAVSKAS